MQKKAKLTFYISGNPLLRQDCVPLKIMDRLKKEFPSIQFMELEPTDSIPEENTLHIIDAVLGIDKVSVIRNIDHIVTGKVYSLHDFDLGFNLKLMKKAGKLKAVRIIGVPAHFDEEKAFTGVKSAIKSL